MTGERSGEDAIRHPPCTDCAHYHVTWDRAAPHGCSAFGFKSRRHPSRVVYENSGAVCELFRGQRPARHKARA